MEFKPKCSEETLNSMTCISRIDLTEQATCFQPSGFPTVRPKIKAMESFSQGVMDTFRF